jgi:hypothetical protein
LTRARWQGEDRIAGCCPVAIQTTRIEIERHRQWCVAWRANTSTEQRVLCISVKVNACFDSAELT